MKVFAVLLIWLHFGSYSEQTALNCSYKVADKALATVKKFFGKHSIPNQAYSRAYVSQIPNGVPKCKNIL